MKNINLKALKFLDLQYQTNVDWSIVNMFYQWKSIIKLEFQKLSNKKLLSKKNFELIQFNLQS